VLELKDIAGVPYATRHMSVSQTARGHGRLFNQLSVEDAHRPLHGPWLPGLHRGHLQWAPRAGSGFSQAWPRGPIMRLRSRSTTS